jgi:serine/threonine protein kinase
MDRAVVPHAPPAVNNFRDGLGERRRIAEAGGDTIELLCLRRELTAIPSFEFALRERASRLASFRHDGFARVRSIDRLNEPPAALAVASNFVRGVRLSQLLTPSRRPLTLDINAALHLIRQTVAAVAALHERARDIAHGAISPDRIIITGSARPMIVEYVLGAALEQLRYTPERYWKELRIALPPGGGAKFDHRADVTQLGMVALSLVLGRHLTDNEHAGAVAGVLASAQAISLRGGPEPLPQGLRDWIGRALQLDARTAFASATEAQQALSSVAGPDAAVRAIKPEPRPAARQTAEWTQPAPAPVAPQPRISPAAAEPTVVAALMQPRPISPAPFPRHRPLDMNLSERRPVTGPARHKDLSTPPPQGSHAVREQPPTFRAATLATTEAPRVEPMASSEASLSGLPEFAPAEAPLEPARPDPAARLFANESEPVEGSEEENADETSRKKIAIAAVVVAVIVAAGVYEARRFFAAPAVVVSTGTLNVTSNPAGAQVFVDRQGRGLTPVSVTLRPGQHSVELRGIGEPRTVDVNIAAGQETSQYFELVKAVAPVFGQLQVRSEPAGARVTVDGVARGKTPMLVEELTPGVHAVVLESDLGTVRQTVTIEAAATASLVVPLSGTAAPVSGWITVAAPVDVEIRERGKVLGTSQSDRIMVAAGRHELQIVNETLGYRSTAVVQVPPAKATPVKLDWPKGTASLNAEPWAEVWIDGVKMGDTPIGNLSLPIGPHEIVFRHPELGEQRHAVSVSLKGPSRVSVDMRKKP